MPFLVWTVVWPFAIGVPCEVTPALWPPATLDRPGAVFVWPAIVFVWPAAVFGWPAVVFVWPAAVFGWPAVVFGVVVCPVLVLVLGPWVAVVVP
ncbi:MAG TPA: hypothetical protein VMG35_11575 [Bryobacteraceae bacterium]|nr:hypothetical protein [Bryobacteraceae bacterium]